METVFELDGPGVIRPFHLKNKVFIIYLPRTIAVETASCINVDTNIFLHLPKEARAFITSKFRGQEIHEIFRKKNRLWIEILNTSYSKDFKIKKKTALGFLTIQP